MIALSKTHSTIISYGLSMWTEHIVHVCVWVCGCSECECVGVWVCDGGPFVLGSAVRSWYSWGEGTLAVVYWVWSKVRVWPPAAIMVSHMLWQLFHSMLTITVTAGSHGYTAGNTNYNTTTYLSPTGRAGESTERMLRVSIIVCTVILLLLYLVSPFWE